MQPRPPFPKRDAREPSDPPVLSSNTGEVSHVKAANLLVVFLLVGVYKADTWWIKPNFSARWAGVFANSGVSEVTARRT